jgi:hypothetical protein
MKAIMRTISTGKAALVGVMPIVIDQLSAKMVEVAKNPGKARFNHYMFETMSGAVRYVQPSCLVRCVRRLVCCTPSGMLLHGSWSQHATSLASTTSLLFSGTGC